MEKSLPSPVKRVTVVNPMKPPIFQGDVEIAIRVAQASEALTGQCFRCNKVRH